MESLLAAADNDKLKELRLAAYATSWLLDASAERSSDMAAPKKDIISFFTRKPKAPYDVIIEAVEQNLVTAELLISFRKKAFNSISIAPKVLQATKDLHEVEDAVGRCSGPVWKLVSKEFVGWHKKLRQQEVEPLMPDCLFYLCFTSYF